MNSKESEYFKSRVAAIINSVKDIKSNLEEAGGFIEPELEEEVYENIDCAIMTLADCLENIESDEAMTHLDEKQSKGIEEEE